VLAGAFSGFVVAEYVLAEAFSEAAEAFSQAAETFSQAAETFSQAAETGASRVRADIAVQLTRGRGTDRQQGSTGTRRA